MEDIDSNRRSPTIGRKVELPPGGVHTEDGFLFHHVITVNLKPEQIERLYEYGINYHKRKRFTAEEDDIVRKNWTEFAKEHDIPYESARFYAGHGDKTKEMAVITKRRQFCLDNNFWPRMCENLVHRSAHQVKRRMLLIFDKAIIEGDAAIKQNKRNPLSYTELMNFIEQYKRHGNMRTAAEEIKKPLVVCNNSYRRYIGSTKIINRGEWICLWKAVLSYMEKKDPQFEKKLQKAIRKEDYSTIDDLSNSIKFKDLEPLLIRKKKFIKAAWSQFIGKLKRLYKKEYLNSQDKNSAWEMALKQISSKISPISADKFCIFLRLLISCIDKKAGYETFKKKHINLSKLVSRMTCHAITGFSVEDTLDTEVDYLLDKVRLILDRCEDHIFSKLVHKFKLKERIQMISLAFDRQTEKKAPEIKKEIEDEQSNDTEDTNGSKNNRIQPTTLRRTPMIEAVILFAKQHDEDWIPPTTFLKYVRDEKIKKLFPDERNNSALLSRDLLKDYGNSLSEATGKRGHIDNLEEEPRKKKIKAEQM